MIAQETLPNGVKIITETVTHVESVSVGIWIKYGARDENDSRSGISHFMEHMLFKGTEKRTAEQIADDFDMLGGHLNAFTEKEYTCYYARVLSEHLDAALEILSDMFLNSILNPKEIELEKKVVLEEIKRHEDSPDELIHDLFAQTVWAGHPLGKSIIGSVECISNLTRDDLMELTRAGYTPDSVLIAAAGNLNHGKLVEQVSALFGSMKGKRKSGMSVEPKFHSASKLTEKVTEQVHWCIGTRGFSHLNNDKYVLSIIDATLGGGMSSRLFQEIREKRGLAYSIGSYSTAHLEGGLFTVFGGTSLDYLEQVADLVRVEFENIRRHNVTPDELKRSKNQIRAALLLSMENMSNRMSRIAKSEIYLNRVIPLDEIVAKVTDVTHADIERVAGNIFAGSAFPLVAVGPFNGRKMRC